VESPFSNRASFFLRAPDLAAEAGARASPKLRILRLLPKLGVKGTFLVASGEKVGGRSGRRIAHSAEKETVMMLENPVVFLDLIGCLISRAYPPCVKGGFRRAHVPRFTALNRRGSER
jgi:hypothetical protein